MDSALNDFRVFFGVKNNFIRVVVKKLEINYSGNLNKILLSKLTRKKKRILNLLLATIFNVNYKLDSLVIYYILRNYLIRSWKGVRIFFNLPSKGQRTKSNHSINPYFSQLLKKKIKDLNKKNFKESIDKKNYFINIKKKTKKKISNRIKTTSKLSVLLKMSSWM